MDDGAKSKISRARSDLDYFRGLLRYTTAEGLTDRSMLFSKLANALKGEYKPGMQKNFCFNHY